MRVFAEKDNQGVRRLQILGAAHSRIVYIFVINQKNHDLKPHVKKQFKKYSLFFGVILFAMPILLGKSLVCE